MSRLAYTLFFIVFCFFLAIPFASAEVLSTPVPTQSPSNTSTNPTSNPSCGLLNNVCCKAEDSNTVAINDKDKSFCTNFFFEICLNNLMENIQHTVNNTIGLDETVANGGNSLDSLQTCKPGEGIPNFVEQQPGSGQYSCKCLKTVSGVTTGGSTKMCSQYIVPRLVEKYGTDRVQRILGLPIEVLTKEYIIDYDKLLNSKEVGTEYIECYNCFKDQGYWSGIGCIRTANWKVLIEENIFKFGMGLAGIITLGCIVFAAVQMQLSQGNPDKIKKSQELLTSCIMGLMVIIFSVFILRVIGVDILRIPGFG